MAKWVPVLVRLEHLQAVSRLIGELEAGVPQDKDYELDYTRPGVDPPSDKEGPMHLARRPVWAKNDLLRLARGSTATTERWSRAMDVCAEEPGIYLPTSEVARRSGMSVAQWRDAPRKISRHLKAHFPDVPRDENDDAVWPLHARSVPEHPGEVSWAITSEMASLWREVRSELA